MERYQGEPLRHLGDLPAMGAQRYEDKAAFQYYGQQVSYEELDEKARRVANALLDAGVEPGDRVGLLIPNTIQFPPAYFGSIKAGAVAVPLNLRMDPETLVYVVEDVDMEYVIGANQLVNEALDLAEAADVGTLFLPGGVDDDDEEELPEGHEVLDYDAAIEDASPELDRPERAFDDVACQPYTSGTTGNPKGVLLTHENLLTTIESFANGGLPIDPDDSVLLILPLFHIYALNALMGSFLYSGGTMVMQAIPNPVNMLNAIQDNELTNFAGVPAMYNMMFREYQKDPDEYDLSSLENVVCAAAPLAEDTRKKIEEAWNVPVVEGWGMTETAPAGTAEPVRGVRKEAGCIGPPVPDVEIKLVDPDTRETKVPAEALEPRGMANPELDFDDDDAVTGEIAIRGDQIFEGYYELPEKNAEVFDDEDWFYTDDIARVDEDGYFWMVDRADDMMLVGGENVYPAEVEDALYAHPAVAEAAVVAASHEIKGEAPVAFVVLGEGDDVTEKELRQHSLNHVATYAHPRRIIFVDELPRSATQKVQRYKLEEQAEEEIGELEPTEEEL
jgi:long-chain acyl-CoA synthetase